MKHIAKRNLHAEEQGLNKNTDLCMDVKTYLRHDRRTQLDKAYNGVLMRDSDVHYNFVESASQSSGKHHPHVFEGRFINVSMHDDGTLQPNFRQLRMDQDFTVSRYAASVARELRMALEGLVKGSK